VRPILGDLSCIVDPEKIVDQFELGSERLDQLPAPNSPSSASRFPFRQFSAI
jgi:hypothetical protein